MGTVNVKFSDFQQNFGVYTKQCREQGNIIELETPADDLNMYVIASHAGVNELLRNECGSFAHFADYFASLEQKSEADKRLAEIFSKNLGHNGPLHVELRKDIRNHFNGNGVDQHGDYIKSCTAELAKNLQKIADKNNGIVDLVKDFNMPLTFLITSHIIGLEFLHDQDKALRIEQASEAVKLINLNASDQVKIRSLEAHDRLNDFFLPQLDKFCKQYDEARQDCLFYDFATKLRNGQSNKLDNYIELVNGIFQAGLGATDNFFSLCLYLVLKGDDVNSAKDIQAYYLDPARTNEEKRDAISEYIRVAQKKFGGIFPRYSLKGGTVQGEHIKENSLIYMSLVSANFDENAFFEAENVNPNRIKVPESISKEALRERRHKRLEKSMSFSYGEHMCPGRRIALTIIHHAMDELFRRYPKLAVDNIEIINEILGKPSDITSFTLRLNSSA
jgi:cytochrome P450